MTDDRKYISTLRKHRNQMKLNVTVLHYQNVAKIYSYLSEELEKMLPIILLLGLTITKPIHKDSNNGYSMSVALN